MAEAASSRFDRQASDPMDEPAERERVLFEASPLPLWVVDLETRRILQVNAAACRAYAYTREEFLTLTQADFLPFDEMAGPPSRRTGPWPTSSRRAAGAIA
jgi:PAS domain-containing protein